MKSSRKGLFGGILLTIVLCVVAAGLYILLQRKMERDSMKQLAAAKTLYEASKWAEAEQLFLNISKKYPKTEAGRESLYVSALLIQAGGRYPEALEQWNKFAPEKASPKAIEAEYYTSQCYERLGKKQEALAGYTNVAAAQASEFASPAKCGLGRLAESEDKVEEAWALYEEALAQAATREAVRESERLLGHANLEIFLTPVESPDKKVYLVKRGDSLVTIAIANKTTVDLICRINGISDTTPLRNGMRLLIPAPEFSIVINKPDFKLTLLNRGKFFKSYTVGLGKHGCTPLGDFIINEKQKNPVWWSPNGPIPAGDPRNELGTRWMRLKPLTPGVGNSYGIHGTINPSTVGWESSNGCPRLYPAEAEELFMLVGEGTSVQIKA